MKIFLIYLIIYTDSISSIVLDKRNTYIVGVARTKSRLKILFNLL